MAHKSTIFAQLLQLLPRHEFETLASRHHVGRKLRRMTRWSQFLALATAQLTGRSSLRDVVANLKAQGGKLYHLGCCAVARSSLARINERQPFELYEAVCGKLLARCQSAAPSHSLRFKSKLISLDASIVSLTLAVFPWAKYQARKGAVKLHLGLDHSGHLPCFMQVSEGSRHEIRWARDLELPAGSMVVFDRAFTDYKLWKSLGDKGVRFVTRFKKGLRYTVLERRNVTWKRGVTSDQRIRLRGKKAEELGLELRKIGFRDPETGKHFVFVTNDFDLAATTIAEIYRQRWQIELFFKWIKQNLKLKSFIGRSKNAVLTQIWVAMIVYLMLAYLKFLHRFSWSLSEILRLLHINLFDRRPLADLFGSLTRPPDIDCRQTRLGFA